MILPQPQGFGPGMQPGPPQGYYQSQNYPGPEAPQAPGQQLTRSRSRGDMMEDVGERIDSPMPAPASHFPQSYQTAAEQQFYSNQPFFHTQYVPPMYTHTPTTHVGRNRGPQESMINRPGFPTKAPARGGRARFQPEDDERLKWLKEKAPVKMSWEQIAEFFPGRKSGTLQVRYCTKLKEKGPIDWNDELDRKLTSAFNEYEEERWKIIAAKVGHNVSHAGAQERWSELEEARQLEEIEGPADPEAKD